MLERRWYRPVLILFPMICFCAGEYPAATLLSAQVALAMEQVITAPASITRRSGSADKAIRCGSTALANISENPVRQNDGAFPDVIG